MKKVLVILLTILMLFPFFTGVLRDEMVKGDSQFGQCRKKHSKQLKLADNIIYSVNQKFF
jgi:hypothetical protein